MVIYLHITNKDITDDNKITKIKKQPKSVLQDLKKY